MKRTPRQQFLWKKTVDQRVNINHPVLGSIRMKVKTMLQKIHRYRIKPTSEYLDLESWVAEKEQQFPHDPKGWFVKYMLDETETTFSDFSDYDKHPVIVLHREKDGKHYNVVLDGNHRACVAYRNGVKRLTTYVLESNHIR